jgi:DNA-binding IclR family transcriptional regulator
MSQLKPAHWNDDAPQYAAPALEKGIDILELLTDAQDGLTMAEIAQALGRSISEIFRMVVTLHRRHWIDMDKGDRYHLTSKMFELAYRNKPIRSLVEVAVPNMQSVSRITRQSCHLSVVKDGRILVVAQVDAPGTLSFGVRTGAIINLLHTASGQIQLAFSLHEVREKLLDQHATLTGEMDFSRRDLYAELDKVAAMGHVCFPSEQVRGVTNLACPVWGRHGEVVAALVIPYLEGLGAQRGPSIEESLACLQDMSLSISKALGYSPPNHSS